MAASARDGEPAFFFPELSESKVVTAAGGRSEARWPKAQFNEMVAACPSVAAAPLFLETHSISFNNISGVGRPPLVQTYCPRVGTALTEARPGRGAYGARVPGTSLGLRPRGAAPAGGAAPGMGGGTAVTRAPNGQAAGRLAPAGTLGHVAVIARGPPGGPGSRPGRPPVAGALGTGRRARPRRGPFSPRPLVTV